ncbi:hypothetical protein D7Z26_26640 [Cohnella endophytica]|uniref:Uncharacterized protein n=1 Tax=Cohnella endophytica TaxID=2419778 RepID=A0A494X4B2_9BACL|nr:hypothetical protein [Cohnella endophytica]RKP44491.1 hypothetical protein D7Z26_26640 [Cohnella endophytica]
MSNGAHATIEKCIGRKVDLIYVDTSGKFSQRRVDLFAIHNGRARVYDVGKRGFRTLVVDRILAVRAVSTARGPL